jgi:hypothetical protein
MLVTILRQKNFSLTRIPLPVKVVLRVAMTLGIRPYLLTSRAVRERDVVVSYIVEEVDFLFL